jgi:hypothetical protein
MPAIGTTKIGWKSCPYCGDDEIYRSHKEPLTWLDRACRLFLLQLARCRRCELRHYRPIFFPAPNYPHPIRGEQCSKTAAHQRSKRSA